MAIKPNLDNTPQVDTPKPDNNKTIDGNITQTEFRNDTQPNDPSLRNRANALKAGQAASLERRRFLEENGVQNFPGVNTKRARKKGAKGSVWDLEAIKSLIKRICDKDTAEDIQEAIDNFKEDGADVSATSATQLLHDLDRLLEGHPQSAELITAVAKSLEKEGYEVFSPEFVDDYLESAKNPEEWEQEAILFSEDEKLSVLKDEAAGDAALFAGNPQEVQLQTEVLSKNQQEKILESEIEKVEEQLEEIEQQIADLKPEELEDIAEDVEQALATANQQEVNISTEHAAIDTTKVQSLANQLQSVTARRAKMQIEMQMEENHNVRPNPHNTEELKATLIRKEQELDAKLSELLSQNPDLLEYIKKGIAQAEQRAELKALAETWHGMVYKTEFFAKHPKAFKGDFKTGVRLEEIKSLYSHLFEGPTAAYTTKVLEAVRVDALKEVELSIKKSREAASKVVKELNKDERISVLKAAIDKLTWEEQQAAIEMIESRMGGKDLMKVMEGEYLWGLGVFGRDKCSKAYAAVANSREGRNYDYSISDAVLDRHLGQEFQAQSIQEFIKQGELERNVALFASALRSETASADLFYLQEKLGKDKFSKVIAHHIKQNEPDLLQKLAERQEEQALQFDSLRKKEFKMKSTRSLGVTPEMQFELSSAQVAMQETYIMHQLITGKKIVLDDMKTHAASIVNNRAQQMGAADASRLYGVSSDQQNANLFRLINGYSRYVEPKTLTQIATQQYVNSRVHCVDSNVSDMHYEQGLVDGAIGSNAKEAGYKPLVKKSKEIAEEKKEYIEEQVGVMKEDHDYDLKSELDKNQAKYSQINKTGLERGGKFQIHAKSIGSGVSEDELFVALEDVVGNQLETEILGLAFKAEHETDFRTAIDDEFASWGDDPVRHGRAISLLEGDFLKASAYKLHELDQHTWADDALYLDEISKLQARGHSLEELDEVLAETAENLNLEKDDIEYESLTIEKHIEENMSGTEKNRALCMFRFSQEGDQLRYDLAAKLQAGHDDNEVLSYFREYAKSKWQEELSTNRKLHEEIGSDWKEALSASKDLQGLSPEQLAEKQAVFVQEQYDAKQKEFFKAEFERIKTLYHITYEETLESRVDDLYDSRKEIRLGTADGFMALINDGDLMRFECEMLEHSVEHENAEQVYEFASEGSERFKELLAHTYHQGRHDYEQAQEQIQAETKKKLQDALGSDLRGGSRYNILEAKLESIDLSIEAHQLTQQGNQEQALANLHRSKLIDDSVKLWESMEGLGTENEEEIVSIITKHSLEGTYGELRKVFKDICNRKNNGYFRGLADDFLDKWVRSDLHDLKHNNIKRVQVDLMIRRAREAQYQSLYSKPQLLSKTLDELTAHVAEHKVDALGWAIGDAGEDRMLESSKKFKELATELSNKETLTEAELNKVRTACMQTLGDANLFISTVDGRANMIAETAAVTLGMVAGSICIASGVGVGVGILIVGSTVLLTRSVTKKVLTGGDYGVLDYGRDAALSYAEGAFYVASPLKLLKPLGTLAKPIKVAGANSASAFRASNLGQRVVQASNAVSSHASKTRRVVTHTVARVMPNAQMAKDVVRFGRNSARFVKDIPTNAGQFAVATVDDVLAASGFQTVHMFNDEQIWKDGFVKGMQRIWRNISSNAGNNFLNIMEFAAAMTLMRVNAGLMRASEWATRGFMDTAMRSIKKTFNKIDTTVRNLYRTRVPVIIQKAIAMPFVAVSAVSKALAIAKAYIMQQIAQAYQKTAEKLAQASRWVLKRTNEILIRIRAFLARKYRRMLLGAYKRLPKKLRRWLRKQKKKRDALRAARRARKKRRRSLARMNALHDNQSKPNHGSAKSNSQEKQNQWQDQKRNQQQDLQIQNTNKNNFEEFLFNGNRTGIIQTANSIQVFKIELVEDGSEVWRCVREISINALNLQDIKALKADVGEINFAKIASMLKKGKAA